MATRTRTQMELTNAERRNLLKKRADFLKKQKLLEESVDALVNAGKKMQKNRTMKGKRVVALRKRRTQSNRAVKLELGRFREVTAALSGPFSKAVDYVNARWN